MDNLIIKCHKQLKIADDLMNDLSAVNTVIIIPWHASSMKTVEIKHKWPGVINEKSFEDRGFRTKRPYWEIVPLKVGNRSLKKEKKMNTGFA